jgi:hypothetical protein
LPPSTVGIGGPLVFSPENRKLTGRSGGMVLGWTVAQDMGPS